MNSRKGFTLVELLAVIVILALIMGIAIISVGSILDNARENSYKDTAITIIKGVRQKIALANQIEEGDYEFTSNILEKGALESPYGGTIQYRADISSCASSSTIDNCICKVNYKTCSATSKSFVRITKDSNGSFRYSICLTAGEDQKYIDLVSEDDLMDGSNTDMIKEASDTPTYFAPNTPTIAGGANKVYNYNATTLTCATTTTYDSDTSVYYEFGYATSEANWTAGTITWLGNASTTATLSVAKSAYRGLRYYGCRVYVSNGGTPSDPVVSTGTTPMSLYNARIYFDATTNGGTISGTTPLYAPYSSAYLYTSRTNTTKKAIPTATKSGATFNGWWTAASGGTQVVNASGTLIATVSGWTSSSKWVRTAVADDNNANRLYAQFT